MGAKPSVIRPYGMRSEWSELASVCLDGQVSGKGDVGSVSGTARREGAASPWLSLRGEKQSEPLPTALHDATFVGVGLDAHGNRETGHIGAHPMPSRDGGVCPNRRDYRFRHPNDMLRSLWWIPLAIRAYAVEYQLV